MENDDAASGAVPAPRAARVRTSASMLGFSPPPVALRLKLLATPWHWSLFLQPLQEARMAQLVDWIEPWSPLRVEFGSRRVMRADFDPVPEAWRDRYRLVEVETAVLYPDGRALATLVGPQSALAAAGRLLSTAVDHVDLRQLHAAPRDAPLLTPGQDEALRAAYDAGYYRIPRPLNLHLLADKLGVSSAALSERLRRAEGRVIARYVTGGSMTPWDARTIFSEHAHDEAHPEVEGAPRPQVPT